MDKGWDRVYGMDEGFRSISFWNDPFNEEFETFVNGKKYRFILYKTIGHNVQAMAYMNGHCVISASSFTSFEEASLLLVSKIEKNIK